MRSETHPSTWYIVTSKIRLVKTLNDGCEALGTMGTLREKTVLSILDFSIFDLKSEPRTTHTKNTKIVIEIFSI